MRRGSIRANCCCVLLASAISSAANGPAGQPWCSTWISRGANTITCLRILLGGRGHARICGDGSTGGQNKPMSMLSYLSNTPLEQRETILERRSRASQEANRAYQFRREEFRTAMEAGRPSAPLDAAYRRDRQVYLARVAEKKRTE